MNGTSFAIFLLFVAFYTVPVLSYLLYMADAFIQVVTATRQVIFHRPGGVLVDDHRVVLDRSMVHRDRVDHLRMASSFLLLLPSIHVYMVHCGLRSFRLLRRFSSASNTGTFK